VAIANENETLTENTAVVATAEVETAATVEVVTPEPAAEAEVEAPKKRRGKLPTKAQIHSVEDVVAFVRGNTEDAAVIKRLKEVFSSKFAEQKELIVDSMWPAISKATPKKQAFYNENVIPKIRNARKPKF